MGVGTYVTGEDTKRYEDKYEVTTPEGVAILLTDIHDIRKRIFERGDVAGVDIMLDLVTAIEKAKLTERQKQVIYYVYERAYSEREAAELLGIHNATLHLHKTTALAKIVAVFAAWNESETAA